MKYGIIYTVKEVRKMRNQDKKPTTIEIAGLVIEAVIAVATLITAIRWW